MSNIGSGPDQTCQWATRDETNIEDGVLWDLFAPIGWRLIRPQMRPMIACTLNCQGRALPIIGSDDEGDSLNVDHGSSKTLTRQETIADDPLSEPIEPATQTAFQEQVCDDSLPPYIGLPRWMPGTLMISETLRFYSDCESSEGPVHSQPDQPQTVPLAKAPPIKNLRIFPPPPFSMPPPIELPPIQQPDVTLPPFEPTPNQIRWLQSALILGNHNPGPIDGMIGGKTIDAIRSWRAEKGIRSLEGELTEDEFMQIIRELGEKFDQVTPGVPRY
ncbi:MAG: peptidoglycan-binding domain-containing protein [Geminicoccaceae bacterium]